MTSAAERCPQCGSAVQPDFRYCPVCGESLDRDSAAERRLVSVLFIDLVDFTALAERLDAEDVRDILGQYFETARSAIARHGGTLEKFIGDAVMAVWGTPKSREDDSERAVRAGLDALAAISEMAVAGHGRLEVRAAVATGEAAVSLPAKGQRLVAGDLVNTAARLQRLAAPGALIVDAATRQLARSAVEFEESGKRRLRGRQKPVVTWRAVPPATGAGGRRRGAHVGPFVGRDTELRQLEAAIAAAVDERRLAVASIVGIAGIGKSRLVWELERRTADRHPTVRWLVGRASDYADAGTFSPLAEVVRQLVGVNERAAPRVVGQKIRAELERLGDAEAERKWLTAALETLLIAGTPAASDQADLFAAWRRFLELAAATEPVVLVMEDAQWARAEMLDFVEYVARTTVSAPIALMALARPDLLAARPAWLSEPTTLRLRLGRISDEAMDALLAAICPELTAPGHQRVAQRADGVPLYAVELVRMLLDHGAIAGERLASAVADLPSTLRAMISARIDALPPDARRTLLTAAVLGSSFARSALLALLDDKAAAGPDLAVLVDRDFLLVERDAIRFVQSLVRDVAQRTLGRRQRRASDLAAADYYASAGPGSADRLAEHLWSAHEGTRDETDARAVAERARRALVAAAAYSSAGRAHIAALGQLERALALTTDPRESTVLHERAGTAARLAARLADAERHFRQAADVHAELGDNQAAQRATAQLAGVLLLGQQNRPALHELERAWRDVGDPAADPAMAELAGQLARVHMILGDDQAAIEWAGRALTMAGDAGTAVAVEARVTRATARIRAGDGNGLDELRQASDEASRAGMIGAELRARNNLSWLLAADDPQASQDSARQAMEVAERYGSRDMVMQLTNVAAAAAVDTGDWQPAIEQLDDLLAHAAPAAYRIDAAVIRAVLGAVRGEADPGHHLDALGRLGRSVDPQLRGVAGYARAMIAFCSGRFDEAAGLARRSARAGVGLDRFKALVLAGRAALWAGDVAQGERALHALEKLEVHGRAADAARLTLRAALAARQGDAAAATALYEQAAQSWAALGASAQLGLCQLERATFAAGSPAGVRAAVDFLDGIGANGLGRLAGGVPSRA